MASLNTYMKFGIEADTNWRKLIYNCSLFTHDSIFRIIQMCSGIARVRVLNVELYAQTSEIITCPCVAGDW